MKPSLKLLLLLLSGLGLGTQGSEIIDGKPVPESEMLYMASVQNKSHKHICGGFLISREFVVTAAHCHTGKPKSVVLGTHNLKRIDDKTMRYDVQECKHPDYVNVSRGADIMLLKLSKSVRLNKRVKTVKLPKAEIKIKDDYKCIVAGWGISTPGGTRSTPKLQKVDVSYMSLDTCKKEWHYLPDNVICAGGFKDGRKGFCQGDSGGPLLCKGVPVGIVSFNRKGFDERGNCSYPNYPNVYTNLSKYIGWINKTMKKKKC